MSLRSEVGALSTLTGFPEKHRFAMLNDRNDVIRSFSIIIRLGVVQFFYAFLFQLLTL